MSSEGQPASATALDRVWIVRRGWFLVVAFIVAVLPLVFQDSYWRTNLIVCAINVMLAIGLDFILGYAQPRPFGVLRHRRLRLHAAHYEAWRAILDGVHLRHRILRRRRHGAVDLRGSPAGPLPCDRLAWLCRHRASGAAELDQPDPRPARHLCDQAAARHCAAGAAGHLVQ